MADTHHVHLGKVSAIHAFPPQEYELALFIVDVQNLDSSWSRDTPACDWNGISCDTLKQVIEICWEDLGLRGALHWNRLPSTVRRVELGMGFIERGNYLSGNVPFEALPPGMVYLDLEKNKFKCLFDGSGLPGALVVLDLSNNQFYGTVDFSLIPASIEVIKLNGNSDLRGVLSRACVQQATVFVRGTRIRIE